METRLPAPCVVVLVGTSSSGKSTWAEANFSPSELVSSDELRGRVGVDENDLKASRVAFQLLEIIVAERISRKLTTVIDSLGFDEERWANWIASAHSAGLPIYAVTFAISETVCLERNASRRRPLSQSAVKKQLRIFDTVVQKLATAGFDGVMKQQPVRAVAPQMTTPQVATESPQPGHTFGLMVSRFDWGDESLPETLAGIAIRAERTGFRDIWLMDHFRQIPSVGRPWEDMPEVYSSLAFLAAQTQTIRLGALVTSITHRNPVVLGKTIATLDVLSGGRANAGLGIGWDEEEHRGYGLEFPPASVRYEILSETIEMLRLLWGKGTPEFEGKRIRASNLSCYPRPIQDHIPILIGGSGERRTLGMVARIADAANVFGNPERVAHKVSVLTQHCAEVGRDLSEIEITHLVNVMTAETTGELNERIDKIRAPSTTREEFSRRNNAGLDDDVVGLFSRYHAAGATHSIISIPDPHVPGAVEAFAPIVSAFRT